MLMLEAIFLLILIIPFIAVLLLLCAKSKLRRLLFMYLAGVLLLIFFVSATVCWVVQLSVDFGMRRHYLFEGTVGVLLNNIYGSPWGITSYVLFIAVAAYLSNKYAIWKIDRCRNELEER
jgi:hypothetical protein